MITSSIRNYEKLSKPLLKMVKEVYKNNTALIKVVNELSRPTSTTKNLHAWKRHCSEISMPINGKYLFLINFAVNIIFSYNWEAQFQFSIIARV